MKIQTKNIIKIFYFFLVKKKLIYKKKILEQEWNRTTQRTIKLKKWKVNKKK